MVETHHTTPVLVVGGGPIGLMTAYQLARLDVPCLLAEQYVSIAIIVRFEIIEILP